MCISFRTVFNPKEGPTRSQTNLTKGIYCFIKAKVGSIFILSKIIAEKAQQVINPTSNKFSLYKLLLIL